MTVLPKFEVLEDRIVLSGADPEVTFTTTDPDEIIELGEQDVAFTLTFDNVGTDSGYVPYAEVIIPSSGADGELDGPTFDSASFLGSPITTTVLTFDAAGEVVHPFLLDAAGDPLIVTGGVLGDTLVVFELPYGSFSPGNPAVDIDVDFAQAIISDLATHLDIPNNRVQIVSVEASRWGETTLGCGGNPETSEEIAIRNVLDAAQVDGYKYVLLVGNTLYEYHTEDTMRYLRCEKQSTVSGEVLIAVDPLASETLRVVQSLLATELDLSTRRVQLVDMLPVTWTDTSLGCPQPEQTYTETTIQGYHIVVTVADELYIYHSDSNTVYPCPLEQSIIPAN